MKELSIEEKAKAYDEVLKKARMFYKDEHVDNEVNSLLEVLFPELKECKESDNEKIRKSIIEFVKQNKSFHYLLGVSKEDAIAWLEKQGEHKPQGKSALEAINEEKVDNANKVEPRQEKLTEFERAVKQVMEEAIECGDTRNLKADAEMLLSLVQESAWSEDDELHIRELESLVKQVWTTAEHVNDKDTIHKMSDLSFFLKTLKPQPKQEWSKDSKRKMYRIYSILGQAADAHAFSTTCRLIGDKECIELQDFLKSLTPQYTWKPSDEQIKAVKEAACYSSVFSEKTIDNLISLSKDLKKLKG